jgi:hypothetical protein
MFRPVWENVIEEGESVLEVVHEFVGVCAAALMGATVLVGGVVYGYELLKDFLPVTRQTLLRLHRLGALTIAALVVVHYVTTDRSHGLLYMGVVVLAAVFVVGLSLHRRSKSFPWAVEAKIVLVVLAGVTLLLGHNPVEGGNKKKTRHRPVVPSYGDDRLASGSSRCELRDGKPISTGSLVDSTCRLQTCGRCPEDNPC